MKRLICAVLLCFACGDDSQMTPVDAAIDSPRPIDAPAIDAPSDAFTGDGSCAGDGAAAGAPHRIYLVFDGVSLVPGNDDARVNHTSLINAASTVPAFAANASNRLQVIDDIATGVRAHLAGYHVEVVTTRPASGDYVMIVFATASSVGLNPSVAAIGGTDCGNANADDVAIVVDMGTTLPASFYANLVMFDLGLAIGVGTNQLADDCMNDMGGGASPCSLSADVAVHQGCGAGGRQNEQALFAAALGCQ